MHAATHTAYWSTVPEQAFGTAHLTKADRKASDVETLETYPIWWLFRGVDSSITHNFLDSFDLSGKRVVFQGVPCVELIDSKRGTGKSTYLWVDPLRDFLAVRYFVLAGDKTHLDLTVQYETQPDIKWFLSKWQYSTANRGGYPGEHLQCECRAVAVNTPVEDTAFQVTYAPGTVVADMRSGQESRYIIREDGKEGERHGLREPVSQQQLASEPAPRSLRPAHLILGLFGAVVCISLLFYRLIQRRQFPSNGLVKE